jgi:two-component system, chemotaxis family, response regulator WspF
MRIGIANDLPMAVEILRRVLALTPAYQVIWVAHNGLEAVRACAAEQPDLILMDLLMPVMDGVEATRQIMAATPCAILVVTAGVGANASRTFEAMGYGALDAVDTPELSRADLAEAGAALRAKIAIIGRLIGDHDGRFKDAPVGERRVPAARSDLLAIGASAGGPAAIAKVLSDLPATFPGAIAIVQHVDEQFAPGMAEWLNQYSNLPVRLAHEGDRLQSGVALLAGTNDHMCLKGPVAIGYTADPISYVYRPSVDVLFQSIAQYWLGDATGVLLTGMGRDGAQGLKAMHNKGHHTIAQDQASSAVYGMPKAAVVIGAASEVLALDLIGPRLIKLFTKGRQNDRF